MSETNAPGERDAALSLDALVASICTFVRTLRPREVEQVDAFVMSLIRERDTWARHEGDRKFHAVEDISGGSVRTMCIGRWAVTDDYECEARPARADRCCLCQTKFIERQLAAIAVGCRCRAGDVACFLHAVDPVSAGLRELVANAPRVSCAFGFDVEQEEFRRLYEREVERRAPLPPEGDR